MEKNKLLIILGKLVFTFILSATVTTGSFGCNPLPAEVIIDIERTDLERAEEEFIKEPVKEEIKQEPSQEEQKEVPTISLDYAEQELEYFFETALGSEYEHQILKYINGQKILESK